MAREAPQVPIDDPGEKVYTADLKATALARTVRANPGVDASFLITLNADTKFISLYAIAQDIYLKWAYTNLDHVNATNFDEVVIAGTRRVFAVPNQDTNGRAFTRIMILGRVAGATAIVIEK